MNDSAQSRTVVHIGYPKCASTYLQRVVFPRLGNFANLSDVSYEESAFLYHCDMDPERYRAIVERHILPAADPKSPRIISSESYVELPFSGFERNFGRVARRKGIDPAPYLHRNEVICENLFRIWPEAYILIVIREPLKWAVSRYDHWYRRDLIQESIESCLDHPGNGYDRLIELYLNRFGPDRIRVVPYEWLLQDSGKFLKAVTEFIDPGSDWEIPNIHMNSKPSSFGEVEYRRMSYRLKHTGVGGIRKGLCRSVNAFLPLSKPWFMMKYGSSPQCSVVPETVAQRLRPQLAASNRRLEVLTGLSLGELGYDVSQEPV